MATEKNNPSWSLKDAFLALLLVYLSNNVFGFLINILGISLSALGNFALASLLQTSGIVLVVYYFTIGLAPASASGICSDISTFLPRMVSTLYLHR